MTQELDSENGSLLGPSLSSFFRTSVGSAFMGEIPGRGPQLKPAGGLLNPVGGGLVADELPGDFFSGGARSWSFDSR